MMTYEEYLQRKKEIVTIDEFMSDKNSFIHDALMGKYKTILKPALDDGLCYYVFKEQGAVFTVFIPDEVTYIPQSQVLCEVLYDCVPIGTPLDIIVVGGRNLTSIAYLFSNLIIKSIILEKFDTQNVTSMLGAFKGTRFTDIEFSEYMNVAMFTGLCTTCNVTDMSSMFEDGYFGVGVHLALESDVFTGVDGFVADNVKSMKNMFRNFRGESIILDFEVPKCTNFSGMFENVVADEVAIERFDTGNRNITTKNMFRNISVNHMAIMDSRIDGEYYSS